MTDRELLERAARAAGLHDDWPAPTYEVQWGEDGLWCFGNGRKKLWNPLADDGDALRLAVRLRIDIDTTNDVVQASVGVNFGVREPLHHDPCAATRRAIVRAAAEMAP